MELHFGGAIGATDKGFAAELGKLIADGRHKKEDNIGRLCTQEKTQVLGLEGRKGEFRYRWEIVPKTY